MKNMISMQKTFVVLIHRSRNNTKKKKKKIIAEEMKNLGGAAVFFLGLMKTIKSLKNCLWYVMLFSWDN